MSRAVLADGSVVEGDVLVAADGVRSRVRRAIDPEAPDARYVGLTNFGGITRGTELGGGPRAARRGTSSSGVARSSARTRCRPVTSCGSPTSPGTRSAAPSARPRRRRSGSAWLADLVADDAGPASDLVAAGRARARRRQHLRPPARPDVVAGRTVLVGDAAHAPSPSSGQGAAMALEDAVVLARALARHGADGLAAYEAARRARVEAMVRAGARSSSAKIPGRRPGRARDDAQRAVPLGGGRSRNGIDHGPPPRTRPAAAAKGLRLEAAPFS